MTEVERALRTEWLRIHREPSGLNTRGPRVTPKLRELLDANAKITHATNGEGWRTR